MTPTMSRSSTYQQPHIAILTTPQGNTFRGNQRNFVDLIRTGRRMGVVVYVMTTQEVQEHRSRVKGFTPTNKGWQSSTFPWPDIVYNRIANRIVEKKPDTIRALRYLQQHPSTFLFNPRFFNKWELYQSLRNRSRVRSYLPETVRYTPSHLQTMIRSYPTLILKETDGKAGIGMIRIQRQPQGYQLCYQGKTKTSMHCKEWNHLLAKVNQLVETKPYLIQPTIPLATYMGRPFDVRMLLQKNRSGIWEISGIGIRVAGAQAISTHVPRGGQIASFPLVIKHAFPGQGQTIRKNLERVGIQFAKEIEQTERSLLGEISLDLGIESNQKIWFFEANAKPMKFDEPSIRKRSLKQIIHFSQYLWEQRKGDPS